jgi:hypothetical protein
MTRPPPATQARFKQVDVQRALKAAKRAGVPCKLEIEAGKITLIPVDNAGAGMADGGKELEPNPW